MKKIVLEAPDTNRPIFLLNPVWAERIKNLHCPFCNSPIIPSDYKKLSDRKEYAISGMCIVCIKKTFEDEGEKN